MRVAREEFFCYVFLLFAQLVLILVLTFWSCFHHFHLCTYEDGDVPSTEVWSSVITTKTRTSEQLWSERRRFVGLSNDILDTDRQTTPLVW